MTRATSFQSSITVAPMIDWTDRHCRFFHRQLSPNAVLYTEMIVDKAIIHGDAMRLLDADSAKDKVVLQLGGSKPQELAQAVKIAYDAGYEEINLNVGCPSDRVQSGTFGAILMKSPELVEEILLAMKEASPARITMKCRIGVDDQDPKIALPAILKAAIDAGVLHVIIHARKAWLNGLSPKENREIPPLEHMFVEQIAKEYSDLRIDLNGGIADLVSAEQMLEKGFGSIMVGRAAYHQPFDILAKSEPLFYGNTPPIREDILRNMIDYIDAHMALGGRLHQVTRHMLGLFYAQAGGRIWRRILSSEATKKDAGSSLLWEAYNAVKDHALEVHN